MFDNILPFLIDYFNEDLSSVLGFFKIVYFPLFLLIILTQDMLTYMVDCQV